MVWVLFLAFFFDIFSIMVIFIIYCFLNEVLVAVDLLGYLQNVRKLLILVSLSMSFEFLQEWPQNSDSVHYMSMVVKSVFFSHSQLIVIVVKAFFGKSNHFSCLSQSKCNPLFALTKFSPLFHDLDNFQNDSFFASLSLFWLGFWLVVLIGRAP